MNSLSKVTSEWKREGKTGTAQFNFFKGGVSSVKLKESSNKLNANGGYFLLDGQFSLDVVDDIFSKWIHERKVGNVTVYYSCGQIVGIHEETTIKL